LDDHIGGRPNISVTAREIGTYSTASGAFSSLGGYIGTTYEFSGGAIPEEIHAAQLTAGVFPTLGVSPALGRVFTQQEGDSHQPLAVMSYVLWLNRYHCENCWNFWWQRVRPSKGSPLAGLMAVFGHSVGAAEQWTGRESATMVHSHQFRVRHSLRASTQ
jgi:hypothetical protein